jgi:hypothetical protein
MGDKCGFSIIFGLIQKMLFHQTGGGGGGAERDTGFKYAKFKDIVSFRRTNGDEE